MAASSVALGTIRFANDAPFVLIGGVNDDWPVEDHPDSVFPGMG